MTGNNKVWRAPVAGLASVAMLATLGVSAMSANASTSKTYTFHVDGVNLQFNTNANVAGVTVEDTKTAVVADDGDNKLDQDDIDNAESALANHPGYSISGWYTTADYGVKDTAVNTNGDSANEVWAHYGQNLYTVVFDDANVVTGGSSSVQLAVSSEGVMDRIADWQVPSADRLAGDGKVMDKTVNNGLGTWKAGDTSIDFDTYDMMNLFPNPETNHSAVLTASPVDAYKITFSRYDFANKEWQIAGVSRGQDYVFDVATGQSIEKYGKIPTASKDGKTVTDWKETKESESVTSATVPTGDTVYKPAASGTKATVTLNYGYDGDGNGALDTKTVTSWVGDEYTPETPSRNADSQYEYAFGGWYTDENFTDEFKAGTKLTNASNDLYAKWVVTGVVFTFDPAYGQEAKVPVTFHTGDEFNAPSVSRDGYTLTGWIVANNESSFNAVKTWTGVKLTIKNNAYSFSGNPSATVTGIRAGQTASSALNDRNFSAKWVLGETLPEALANLENAVDVYAKNANGDVIGYKAGKDQSEFTVDTFNEYVDAFKDYLDWKNEHQPVTNDDYEAAVAKISEAQSKLVQKADTVMYRLYNKYNGDHLYTTDVKEYEDLTRIGWTAEGPQFKVVSLANASVANFGTRVYRLFNPYNSEHLMTTDQSEVADLEAAGWTMDNVVFYAPQGGNADVTRLFNPYVTTGTHLYTTDQSEVKDNVARGWLEDGVIFSATAM